LKDLTKQQMRADIFCRKVKKYVFFAEISLVEACFL